MTIDKKYLGKTIYIAFRMKDESYLYDHDALVRYIEAKAPDTIDTISWRDKGLYNWPYPPKWAHPFLSECKLP